MSVKSSDKSIVDKLKSAEIQRKKQDAMKQKANLTHINDTKLSPSNRIDTAVEAEAFYRESINGPTDTMIELETIKDNLGTLDTVRELQARNEGPGVINTPDRAKAIGKEDEDTDELPSHDHHTP